MITRLVQLQRRFDDFLNHVKMGRECILADEKRAKKVAEENNFPTQNIENAMRLGYAACIGNIRRGQLQFENVARKVAEEKGYETSDIDDALPSGRVEKFNSLLLSIKEGKQNLLHLYNEAKEHAQKHGGDSKAIEDAFQDGYKKMLETISQGELFLEENAREIAKKYNLPPKDIDDSISKGYEAAYVKMLERVQNGDFAYLDAIKKLGEKCNYPDEKVKKDLEEAKTAGYTARFENSLAEIKLGADDLEPSLGQVVRELKMAAKKHGFPLDKIDEAISIRRQTQWKNMIEELKGGTVYTSIESDVKEMKKWAKKYDFPTGEIDKVLPEAKKNHFEHSLDAMAIHGTIVINDQRMKELEEYARENGKADELQKALVEYDNWLRSQPQIP